MYPMTFSEFLRADGGESIYKGVQKYEKGRELPLSFYADAIIPVEAKAELHTRAKSYQQFCKKYHPAVGFKFSMKNVGNHEVSETKTYSIPLYLIWMIKQYLK